MVITFIYLEARLHIFCLFVVYLGELILPVIGAHGEGAERHHLSICKELFGNNELR